MSSSTRSSTMSSTSADVDVSTSSSISPDQTSHYLIGLIHNVRGLAGLDDFKDTENLFHMLDTLKKKLKTSEEEVKRLSGDLGATKSNEEAKRKNLVNQHDNTKHEILKTHRESMAMAEAEKMAVEVEVASISARLAESKTNVTSLEQASNQLEQQILKESESHKETKTRLIRADTEIKNARIQIEDKDKKIESDKEKMKKQGKLISTLNTDLETAKQEGQSVRDKFERCVARLKKVEGYAAKLDEDRITEASTQLQNLWLRCEKVVRSCFDKDLGDVVLNDPMAWKELKATNQVTHSIPLPQTNSHIAKSMRTVVVLAILAASLAQHIFSVTYQLEEDGGLRDVLLELAETNQAKEAFFRGLLASLPENRVSTVMKKRTLAVVREVSGAIKDLLEPNLAEQLRSELLSLVDHATQIWKSIQRRQSRFEADVDAVSEIPWQWKGMVLTHGKPETMAHNVSSSSFEKDDVGLVTFPRIYIVDVQEDKPIFSGVVVQMSQMTMAQQEIEQMVTSSPSLQRVSTGRTNRRSRTSTLNGYNKSTPREGGSF